MDSVHTCAVVSDLRQVCVGIEAYSLVARVITRHVTLSTVDAHVLHNNCIQLKSIPSNSVS
jgi:hypothetical protein